MSTRIRLGPRYFSGALGLLSLGLQAAPQPPLSVEASTTARIEGHVVAMADGRALTGASVRLRRYSEALSAADPNEAAYTAQAGPAGLYVFDGIAPGNYRIYADQPGYVRQFYGARSSSTPGTVLRLAPSQELKGLDIKLPTQGAIAGHVQNQDGEPVNDAIVSALRISYGAGRRLMIPMALTDTTADGEFSLRALPPGRYYVRVDQKATPFVAGSTKQGQREVFQKILRRTYYPDATEPEAAAAITVAAGSQLTGIDFRVKPGKMFRVQGNVVWGGVSAPDRPLVLALTTAAFDVQATIQPYLATVQADGAFRFEEVVAGTYYLEPARLVVDVSHQRTIGGSMTVAIRDEDLTDIEFRLVPAPSLIGKILLDGTPSTNGTAASANAPMVLAAAVSNPRTLPVSNGAPPPPPPGQASDPSPPAKTVNPSLSAQAPSAPSQPLQNGAAGSAAPGPNSPAIPGDGTPAISTPGIPVSQTTAADTVIGEVAIRLRAVGRMSVNAPQTVSSADGTFSLHALPLGRYRVAITNLAEGAYVKSVLFSGRDITNSDLDLAPGADGELNIVLAKDAGEVSGTVRDVNDDPLSASVVSVWPTDRGLPDSCRIVETGNLGAFRLKHLAPGEYRVVAWEEIDPGLAGLGDFCRLFSADAVPVVIDERGGAQSVNLKAISPARIEEAIWKLPR
jgi:hypothetical protein